MGVTSKHTLFIIRGGRLNMGMCDVGMYSTSEVDSSSSSAAGSGIFRDAGGRETCFIPADRADATVQGLGGDAEADPATSVTSSSFKSCVDGKLSSGRRFLYCRYASSNRSVLHGAAASLVE